MPRGSSLNNRKSQRLPIFSTSVPITTTPQSEQGILWNDPAIGIQLPITEVKLSDKNKGNHPLPLATYRAVADLFGCCSIL